MPPVAPALPLPDSAARAHSARVAAALRADIVAAGGWISFEAYMRFVLYAPGLGYYVAGARKFGRDGDFVTAPELTPLFAEALAVQARAVLDASRPDIVELGAGTGALAAALLAALEGGDGRLRYRILEPSPELRERQRRTIAARSPALVDRVEWLDTLPDGIDGIVLLNEVLDAVPPHLVVRTAGEWHERGVRIADAGFAFEDRPLSSARLRAVAADRFPADIDYASEINPAAEALVNALARRLRSGALVILDYGFPRHELYHPQRSGGTVMAHYRHRSLADPLLWPGLMDVTAHVDFTAMAEAGVAAGLDVAGFASQSAFLLSLGILDRLAAVAPPGEMAYVRAASAVQTLLSPSEMGELFKVLALSRGPGIGWPGFATINHRHRL